MKKYQDVEVPARVEKKHTATLCDRCGEDVEPSGYAVDEAEVRCRTGHSYPDGGGGSGFDYELDLCATCFVDWLIPLLKSHGVEVRESEWDY